MATSNGKKPLKYFLYDEVCIHNKRDDFWVVVHDNVYDLTPMLQDRQDSWNDRLEYLLAFGGKDLTHFFHENLEPKTEISGLTGAKRVLFPPILEVSISEEIGTKGEIWSQDDFYQIGRCTRRPRKVRIINTLTATTIEMTVCDEDNIYEIQRKYKNRYNSHAGSYYWRKFSYGGRCEAELDFNKTLDENGLIEEESQFPLPHPSIWLYYSDDMTIA